MYLRSLHFVPGHRPEFLAKVHSLPADGYIFDLEDAVPSADKRDAVQNIIWFLHDCHTPDCNPIFIRVNAPDSPIAAEEHQLFAQFPKLGVVFPKVRDMDDFNARKVRLGLLADTPCIILFEDPAGLDAVDSLARIGRPAGIGLGLEDFFALSIHPREELQALSTAIRVKIALAAMSAQIPSFDTISLDLGGGVAFMNDCREAKSCGLTGKFTIHPNQIEPCNKVFGMEPGFAEEAAAIAGHFGDKPPCGYVPWNGNLLSPPKVAKAIFATKIMKKLKK
jgi:citrate lyase subunit beta / citryl-CoA lyase